MASAIAQQRTIDLLGQIAAHPAAFGAGTGVANGVLASVRDLKVSPRAAVITAIVIGAGEAALASEIPKGERRTLLEIAGYSMLGTLTGLWLFVSPGDGKPSLIQRLTPSRSFAKKE